MPRDFLETVRSQVVVFDGGMGATLEQFELTADDYGGLQGKCHEALVLNRPDVIEGVHTSMVEAGATCLCITAGKTLMFDRDEMIRAAEKNKIAIVAV